MNGENAETLGSRSIPNLGSELTGEVRGRVCQDHQRQHKPAQPVIPRRLANQHVKALFTGSYTSILKPQSAAANSAESGKMNGHPGVSRYPHRQFARYQTAHGARSAASIGWYLEAHAGEVVDSSCGKTAA
jgi:hypothetical protein